MDLSHNYEAHYTMYTTSHKLIISIILCTIPYMLCQINIVIKTPDVSYDCECSKLTTTTTTTTTTKTTTTTTTPPPGTCNGRCGGRSDLICWCNTDCDFYKDCCTDFNTYCTVTRSMSSCYGYCGGQSDADCWCDFTCAKIGDCCSDYENVCVDIRTTTL